MNNLPNKKASQDDQIDRISDLPCNVIDDILAHLEDIKDLVRTSTLSKKWRYMWTSSPQLRFDDDFFLDYEDLYDPGPVASKIITDVLMQHNGPIYKFQLFIPFDCNFNITIENLNTWIAIFSRRDIKHLELENHNTHLHQMPYIVLSCKELTYFTFAGFNLSIPHDFCGFKRLLNLYLYSVTFEPGALESLVSGCPLLETLKIEDCDGFDYFDFAAPTIKVLSLEFDQNLKSICLKKATNLVDLTLMTTETWVSGLIKSWPKNIQRISIRPPFDNKILYADIFPPMLLKSTFSSTKYLKLSGVNLNERRELLHIVNVLKSAPALVELVVEIDDNVNTPQVSDHSEELEYSGCCLKLQTVDIYVDASSHQHTMSLIQFILANSKLLKTLTFNVGIGSKKLDAPMLLRISQELLWMERASPRAHIQFLHGA